MRGPREESDESGFMPFLVFHCASLISGSRRSQSRGKPRQPHAAAQRRSDIFSSNRPLAGSSQSKNRSAPNRSASRESRGAAVRGQQLGHANPSALSSDISAPSKVKLS